LATTTPKPSASSALASTSSPNAEREEAGRGESITETDLYPDVRPALTALQQAGFWVGIAGNQTTRTVELLAALDLEPNAR